MPCGSTRAFPSTSRNRRWRPESAYRAADIRWQIEAVDAATRPSSNARDPALRYQMNEDHMRQVMKKYPRTKWADLAAYHILDNKLCGEWEAEAKCPELEAALYLKYADEHPQSPRRRRRSTRRHGGIRRSIEIYNTANDGKKSEESASRSLNVARKLVAQYASENDWWTRAAFDIHGAEQGSDLGKGTVVGWACFSSAIRTDSVVGQFEIS